ncbi:MAG: CRTAC1 family protein [Pirellulaceae bacterium]|nr:CRTAC1 family protein [Pirellulaceae bacterium]
MNPSRPSATPASLDAHQLMIETLAKIERDTGLHNPYLGRAQLIRAEQNLARAGQAPTMQLCQFSTLFAWELLRVGEVNAAIEQLEKALSILEKLKQQNARVPAETERGIQFFLAVSYLRLGETQNCVHCTTGENCIFPITAGGVHTDQAGSRQSIGLFVKVLESEPENLAAKWLMNLAHMTLGEYPQSVPTEHLIPIDRFEKKIDFPRFPEVATGLNIDAFSHAGGAIADDFNGDGWLDIIVSSFDLGTQIRYFHNNGNGSFSDKTEEAGLVGITGGLNLVQADYDNDGDLDFFALRGAWLSDQGIQQPHSLLCNDGQGHFRDVTFEAGFSEIFQASQTASWADFDNDGYLDLYIGNELGPANLYHNNHDGTFSDVATKSGVENNRFAKGVIWGDFDNDRYPDIYVSNLGHPNRLYHNNRDGTFRDIAVEAGVTQPNQSLPAWFWDFDNDGALDIFCGSYEKGIEHVAGEYFGLPTESERDALYQGDGKGNFRDVTAEQNVDRVTQPMGSNFGDLDNDGFLDYYLGTGYPDFRGLMPNLMFRNTGGQGFVDVTNPGGFGHLQKGHGIAFADLDHDGDQDVYIELGGFLRGDAFRNALFENPGFANNWIKVKLTGTATNRCAIGTRIKITFHENDTQRSVYRWVCSGGSFGGNPLRQHIGIGKAASIDALEIQWPTSSTTQSFADLPVNCLIEVAEGETTYQTSGLTAQPFSKPTVENPVN